MTNRPLAVLLEAEQDIAERCWAREQAQRILDYRDFPKDVIPWGLLDYLTDLCLLYRSDNFRIARLDHPEEVAKYNEQRLDGCCGFADSMFQYGRTIWLVGCNYGH